MLSKKEFLSKFDISESKFNKIKNKLRIEKNGRLLSIDESDTYVTSGKMLNDIKPTTKLSKEEKKTLIEKKKEEYIQLMKSSITEHYKPVITKANCLDYLDNIEDKSIDALITDPPYISEFTEETFMAFVKSWLYKALDKIKETGRCYICISAAPDELYTYISLLKKQSRFIVDNPIIWEYKNTLGVTPRNTYIHDYQMILHLYTKQSNPLDNTITNEMFSVMNINAPDGRLGNRFFKWQKPDELIYRLIKHSTKESEKILDLFAGSGTISLIGSKMKRVVMSCDNNDESLSIAETRGCIIEKDVDMNKETRIDMDKSIKGVKLLISSGIMNKLISGEIKQIEDIKAFEKLDMEYGIDYVRIKDDKVDGISTRVQFGKDYSTFTIRLRRNKSNAKTEYEKRISEINNNKLRCVFTLQAYVNEDITEVLSVAICRTEALYRVAEDKAKVVKATNMSKYNNDFYVVNWSDFDKDDIRIWRK